MIESYSVFYILQKLKTHMDIDPDRFDLKKDISKQVLEKAIEELSELINEAG